MKKIDYSRDKYGKNDSGLIYLLVLIIPQLVAVIFSFVFVLFKLPPGHIALSLSGVLISQLCFIGIYIIYNKKRKINLIKASNISFKIDWVLTLLCVLISLICLLAFNYFVGLFDELLKLIGYSRPTDLPLPLTNIGWLFINILLLAVFPAICEECIFRGIIFNGLSDNGKLKTIIFTGILFSLFHTSPLQTVYQLIFGIVLGAIMWYTKNLIYPIIVHFVNNFAVVLINYIMTNRFSANALNVELNALNVCLIILGAVAGGFAIWGLILLVKKRKAKLSMKMILHQEEIVIDENTTVNSTSFIDSIKNNKYLVCGMLIALALWVVDLITYI